MGGSKMILTELAGYKEPVKQTNVVSKQRNKIEKLAKKKRKKATHNDVRAASLKSLTSMLGGLNFK